jgi:hypothetical protein
MPLFSGLARRGGEMHENLPVDAADRHPFDGGPLHLRTRTALETTLTVKIFPTRLIHSDLRDDRFAHLFLLICAKLGR